MLPGVIGVIQATEAIKLLVGMGEPLIGRLLTYDALGMRFREVKLRRDPKCPVCGEKPSITDLHPQGGRGGRLRHRRQRPSRSRGGARRQARGLER